MGFFSAKTVTFSAKKTQKIEFLMEKNRKNPQKTTEKVAKLDFSQNSLISPGFY